MRLLASKGGSIGGIWNQGTDAFAGEMTEEEKSAFPSAILAES